MLDSDDPGSFVFETPRQTLAAMGEGLRKLTDGRCFYCGTRIREVADVDHFVPRSLYPRELMHNFVPAHPACNRSKSDTLAARPHLERWLEFITKNNDALHEIGRVAGRVSEPSACRAVARWGYANAASTGAHAWLRASSYESVDQRYLDILA